MSFLHDAPITSVGFARIASRFYRSLRAVKVLLATLRSTLTVLASRMGGLYRFALEKQLLTRQQHYM
jgi:hypothetical protein